MSKFVVPCHVAIVIRTQGNRKPFFTWKQEEEKNMIEKRRDNFLSNKLNFP